MHIFFPSPFENSPFQKCLYLLIFHSIPSSIDEFSILPFLYDCLAPLLGDATEPNCFEGCWLHMSLVLLLLLLLLLTD